MMTLFKPFLIIFMLFHTVTIWAEEDKQYLLTEKTYKALNSAQELMAADKNTEAEKKLISLLQKVAEASYEQAVVQQTIGYLYSTKEEYKKASQFFKQALD